MKRLIPLLFCGLFLWSCNSTQDLQDVNSSGMSAADFAEGNKLMNENSWDRAISVFERLNQQEPENANIQYKLGLCYLNTATEKGKALPYLKSAAAQKAAKNYDPFNPLEDKAPVEAHYYLGRAQHLNYELDEAQKSYKLYMGKVSRKHQLHAKAQRQIEMCKEAEKQMKTPKNFRVSNLGEQINSEYNDFSPIISLDENVLFYTSRRVRPDSSNVQIIDTETGEYKEDIYVSYKDRQGNWSDPELLNINRDDHSATVSVSPDGQTLFIYYDEDGDGQLYKSILIGETWSEPELLGSNINTKYWETHATTTADQRTLYFTSNRKGGYGGRDIYRVVTLPTGNYSKALNLGPVINTPYEEESPFISPDGNTMYFASQGHESMGGFDIFFSSLDKEGNWSEPENIGYPLNTVDDDVFFVPTADSQRAYYASEKGTADKNYGLKDIYVLDIPENRIATDLTVLKGYMVPEEGTALPEDLSVVVTDQRSSISTAYSPRARDGAFVVILPPCEDYTIEYLANGEVVKTEEMTIPCESSYREIEREVMLNAVVVGGGEPLADTGETGDGANSGDGTGSEDGTGNGSGTASGNDGDGSDAKDYEEMLSRNGMTFSSYDAKVAQASFNRFYDYDRKEIGTKQKEWKFFIKNLKKIIDVNGDVTIDIEASASHVPSSDWKDNEDLAQRRLNTAKDEMEKALKRNNIDMSKVKFGNLTSAVNGPLYNNDAVTKRDTYYKFQYTKVVAR